MKLHRKLTAALSAVLSGVLAVSLSVPAAGAAPSVDYEVYSVAAEGAAHTEFYYDKETGQISFRTGFYKADAFTKYWVYLYHLNENGKAELEHSYHYFLLYEGKEDYYVDNTATSKDAFVSTYNEFKAGKTKLDVEKSNSRLFDELSFVEQYQSEKTNVKSVKLYRGRNQQLYAGITLNHDDQKAEAIKLIWESSNPTIASVTEDGKATGESDGICYIRARIEGTSLYSAEYLVKVGQDT